MRNWILVLVLFLAACTADDPIIVASVTSTTTTTTTIPIPTTVSPATTTTPVPTTTTVSSIPPAPRVRVLAPIDPLVESFFGTEAQAASNVAQCESTWDPTQVGRAGERGWFQIHPGWWTSWGYHQDEAGNKIPIVTALGYTADDLFDPAINTEVAWNIWLREGWTPWTCRP